MQMCCRTGAACRSCAAFALSLLVLFSVGSPRASGQAWLSYAHDSQHSSEAANASQIPQTIRWKTPVDLFPQYAGGGDLYIHYGSPLITSKNTVLVPVKTAISPTFRLEAHNGTTGNLLWLIDSDWTPPDHNWVPPMGPTLTPESAQVVMPGAGGTVLFRSTPDTGHGNLVRVAFYNTKTTNYYGQNLTAFNNAIQICTPITSDSDGNLYFGYLSSRGRGL